MAEKVIALQCCNSTVCNANMTNYGGELKVNSFQMNFLYNGNNCWAFPVYTIHTIQSHSLKILSCVLLSKSHTCNLRTMNKIAFFIHTKLCQTHHSLSCDMKIWLQAFTFCGNDNNTSQLRLTINNTLPRQMPLNVSNICIVCISLKRSWPYIPKSGVCLALDIRSAFIIYDLEILFEQKK